jgi:putative GTP pyrophosphokinase
MLPAENKDDGAEDYADLLVDLQQFQIRTRGALRSLFSKHMPAVLRADAKEVRNKLARGEDDGDEDTADDRGERVADRLARGVFYTHVGLTRQALSEQFGKEFRAWQLSRGFDA